MKVKTSLILIALLIAVLCRAETAHGSPNYGGTVVVAIASDPGGLNPAITTQGGVHLICGSIFSGLVAHDFNLNPVPDLAQRWEVSLDGKTYTFHLAPEAVFHDGAPVTSADVKFTFEQLLMKYHSRTRTSVGDNLEQVSTPDAHTVVFQFRRPYAAFLQLIDASNAPVMPKHLYEGTDPLTNSRNTNPVGSGPFKLQEWQKGNHLTLVKNPRYFKPGKPYLDRVVYKVMPTGALATIAFERGEVDYLMGASPLDIARLRAMPGVVVTTKGREGFAGVETFIPNLTRAPLSDLRVRKAIAHAIDKQFLVDKLLFGQGIVATGPVSHMLAWAYNPNVEKYEHKTALANQLLDEAGQRRGSDGIRFHLKFVHAASYAKVAEALRDQLREVGIAVDLQLMEFAAAVDAVYIKKDFDLGFASFENGPDPDVGVKRTVVSSNIGPIPFSNGAGYRNPRVDELFAIAASELDKQKRAGYYFEAQEILVKDLPYFWLYEPNSSAAYRAGLQGMYEWSAKSNAYFAQDAWWADGGRTAHT
ncbi:MAG: ABC transporter substrate-binding protein, partial [Acidobacteria bacterium]|nr:ABC transporter substrate-binding protein [Acidobacteriota bacterium]